MFEGIKNRSNLAEQLLRSGFPQYPPLRARSPDKSDQSTIETSGYFYPCNYLQQESKLWAEAQQVQTFHTKTVQSI